MLTEPDDMKSPARLLEINAVQVARLAAADAVVILPISPIEEHGPHLPMGTDAIHAEYFASLASELIEELAPETPVVMAPLIPLGNHVFPFMGSINVRRRVIRNLVVDFGRSLAQAGFRRFVIVSAHGGPGHMVALDEAATILTHHHGLRSVNLTSTIIYRFLTGKLTDRISAALPQPLTDEERRVLAGDFHAGWWETAMMQAIRPDLVDESYRNLPDLILSMWRLRRFRSIKPPLGQGYLGAPRRADAAFAAATLQVLRAEATDVMRRFLDARTPMRVLRSPLYWVPVFRTNFWIWVWVAAAVILVVVWVFFNR